MKMMTLIHRLTCVIRNPNLNPTTAAARARLLSTRRTTKSGEEDWNDAWETAWLPDDLSGKYSRAPWESDVSFSLPTASAPQEVDADTQAFVEDMNDNWDQRKGKSVKKGSDRNAGSPEPSSSTSTSSSSLYSSENIKRDYRLTKQKINAGLWVKEIEKLEEAKLGVFVSGSADIEKLLDSASDALDPDLLLSVINSTSHRPRVVLKIFRWAEGRKGFKHSEFVFCRVLEILVENDMMSPAYWVVERVIDGNMEAVVDVLVDGYSNSEVSHKVLDLLLWVCTKKSDVERCLWVFDKMVKSGFLPDVKNCNRILRVLRDRNLDDKAREFYESMGQYGIEPTIVTYNTMLDIFFRYGYVQKALDLLQEMQSVGWSPNDVTYNVLIDGLSKKGEIEKAREFYDEMLSKGLKLSIYSYNSLISGYCHKGMLIEALGLEEEMENRGTLPNVSTYNALMHGYCKQGRVSYARQWIPVMLKKNMELDVISYNTLIHGYCVLGDISEAFFLLSEMRKMGIKPTIVTFNIVVDGLSKIGDLEGARQVKNEMSRHEISPDIFTYTILISGSYKMQNLSMAKEFYDEMLQAGLKPDRVAYATCIACELKLGHVDVALKFQEEMLAKGYRYNVSGDGILKLSSIEEDSELSLMMKPTKDVIQGYLGRWVPYEIQRLVL